MAAEQGIKSLKIESRNKIPLCPADWIAGVDHTDSDSTGDDDDSQDGDYRVPANTPYQYERDVNNEEIFDPIDEEELEEPLADENAVDHRAMDVEELIPDVVEEDEPEANEEEQPEEESNPINSIQENEIAGVPEPDEPAEPNARPARNAQPPERMTHNKFGSPVKAARNHFQKLPIEVC